MYLNESHVSKINVHISNIDQGKKSVYCRDSFIQSNNVNLKRTLHSLLHTFPYTNERGIKLSNYLIIMYYTPS